MTNEKTVSRCPHCGESASGNFCHHCGGTLGGQFCNQCGSKVAAGGKFCNECGAKADGASVASAEASRGAARAPTARRTPGAGAAARRYGETVGGQSLPWWTAGAAMFAVIFMIGLQMVRPGAAAGPTAGASSAAPVGGAPGTGAPPDISNMTPVEAADRLFDRVMRSISAGDSAAAQQFMPMAIAAYQRARPLTLDGLFHLSMLNRTAMNLEAALDVALEVVERDPNHLLGLAAAAEAAIELGLLDEAETHYRQILAVFDAESQRPLEEYDMHSQIVVVLKQDAEQFLATR
jgi:tetratricopeptide (TPR) repeat protein